MQTHLNSFKGRFEQTRKHQSTLNSIIRSKTCQYTYMFAGSDFFRNLCNKRSRGRRKCDNNDADADTGTSVNKKDKLTQRQTRGKQDTTLRKQDQMVQKPARETQDRMIQKPNKGKQDQMIEKQNKGKQDQMIEKQMGKGARQQETRSRSDSKSKVDTPKEAVDKQSAYVRVSRKTGEVFDDSPSVHDIISKRTPSKVKQRDTAIKIKPKDTASKVKPKERAIKVKPKETAITRRPTLRTATAFPPQRDLDKTKPNKAAASAKQKKKAANGNSRKGRRTSTISPSRRPIITMFPIPRSK